MSAGVVALAALSGALLASGIDCVVTRNPVVDGAVDLRSGNRVAPPRSRVSARRVAVTSLTSGIWALLALRFGATGTGVTEAIFATGLVALAATDAEELRLPKAMLYPTLAATAAAMSCVAVFSGSWHRFGAAALGGLVAWLVLLALHLIRPAWMGFGDVRLAALIGVGVGWVDPRALVLAFLVTNISAAAVGLALMAAGRATRSTPLPYGVFLAIGAVSAILLGHPVS